MTHKSGRTGEKRPPEVPYPERGGVRDSEEDGDEAGLLDESPELKIDSRYKTGHLNIHILRLTRACRVGAVPGIFPEVLPRRAAAPHFLSELEGLCPALSHDT